MAKDWKAEGRKRTKKIMTPPESKAGYNIYDTEDTTDAPNVAKSVSERGDLGSKKSVVKSHGTRGGPTEPQTKTPTKITPKKDDGPSKRVQTAFEKRQKALRTQAVKDALKPVKPKKKTATELSREFVKEKKEKIALDKQTDALVAEKEAGRRLPQHLQKQKKVTAKKRVYPDPKSPKPVVSTKKRVYPKPEKADRAISKSANVEAPDEKTKTVKVPKKVDSERKTHGPKGFKPTGKKPGMDIRGGAAARKRKAKLTGKGVETDPVAPKPPKTTAKPVKTAKDAKAETSPESQRKRRVAEDKVAFGISRGGTKEDPSKGFRFNLFGKNKTKAEADEAMARSYKEEQWERKRDPDKFNIRPEGRRSSLKQTAKKGGTVKSKKGGTVKSKKGGAIKRTYNTGGTIRFKSGGAVVDTYDY